MGHVSNTSRLLASLFLAVALLTPGAIADQDHDGVSDADEAALLARHSPVWISDSTSDRPPLPLSWYVEQCQLRWYDKCNNPSSDPGTRLGDSGSNALSLDALLSWPYIEDAHYRLSFKNPDARDGTASSGSITWQRLQSDSSLRVLLGRVRRVQGARALYVLQYYLFFGNNVGDSPNSALGVCTDWGDHEGDVIGVEFIVSSTNPLFSSRIESGVFNNHGRKIFVDSPSGFVMQGNRPVVYLEREVQEPLPFASHCGFTESTIPPSVGTNKIFESPDVPVWSFGGECEDFQVVREHRGQGLPVVFSNIVNLGEKQRPGSQPEARFLDTFGGLTTNGGFDCDASNSGRFGDYANNQICVCYLLGKWCFAYETKVSPQGPSAQMKMWAPTAAEFTRTNEYPGTPLKPVELQVSFADRGGCGIVVTGSLSQGTPTVVWLQAAVTDDRNRTLTVSRPFPTEVFSRNGRFSGFVSLSSEQIELLVASGGAADIVVTATAAPGGMAEFDATQASVNLEAVLPEYTARTRIALPRSVSTISATRIDGPNAPANITITFRQACGASSYRVFRDDLPNPISVISASSASQTLSVVDSNTLACLPYTYRVQPMFGAVPGTISFAVVGYRGAPMTDIVLSNTVLQGQQNINGRVRFAAPPTASFPIQLYSSVPNVISIPEVTASRVDSRFSNFFPVNVSQVLCPTDACAPQEVVLRAESSLCSIDVPFIVKPVDSLPEWSAMPIDIGESGLIADGSWIPAPGALLRFTRDYTNDGQSDIVIQAPPASQSPGSFSILSFGRPNGSRPLGEVVTIFNIGTPFNPNSEGLLVANFDSSFGTDILAFGRTVFPSGQVTGPFTTSRLQIGRPDQRVGDGIALQSSYAVAFDWNNDGVDDVVGEGLVSLGLGDGRFQTATGVAIPVGVPLKALDVNDDRRIDLVYGNIQDGSSNTSSISVYLGTPTGVVAHPDPAFSFTFPMTPGTRFVDADDFDRDGTIDFAFIRRAGVDPDREILTPSTFVAIFDVAGIRKRVETDLPVDMSEGSFLPLDIDSDGDLDFFGGTIVLRLRSGGVFSVGLPGTPALTFPVDVDRDGDVDLVTLTVGRFSPRVIGRVLVRYNSTNPLGTPRILSPGATVALSQPTVALSWTAATGASSYVAEVSTSASFDASLTSVTTSATAADVPITQIGGTIFARVRARSATGFETRSEIQRIETVNLNLIDCNANGVYDASDIASGWSRDLNANALPDECERGTCDPIDFNQNSLFPEDQDLIDLLSVLAGGPCSPGNTCNDIDFNNDGLFPADDDLVAFLRVLAGGSCN